jgi:O-antigen/teichoic acid export membrane protein
MLTIFIAIGQTLMNSGFGQALIQKTDSDQTDFSTVFYFNILSGIFFGLIICYCSPFIAKFYDQPQLSLLAKVLSFSFVISSFGWIHQIHLNKSIEFKAQSIISVTSVLFSGAIGIYLALTGFGVWSLVIQTLIRNTVTVLLLWKVNKWRPALIFSFSSLKGLFAYGSRILLGSLLATIFNNIYLLVIGRLFNAQSLGYYTRATQFKDLPVNTINSIVQRVAYPVFAKIQDDDEKLITGFHKVSRSLVSIALPLMVILLLTANPLIHFLLTDKWMPAVPYLQLLCTFGWIYVLQTTNVTVFTVKGRSDYYLNFQLIEKAIIIVAIVVTYPFGIKAMIYGQMVSTVMSYFLSSFYMRKVIGIKLRTQLKNILPFLLSSVLMLSITFLATATVKADITNILLKVVIGTAVYITTLWLLRVEEVKLAFNYLRRFFKRN